TLRMRIDFPQQFDSSAILAWVGNIQGEQGAASRAKSPDQHCMPGIVEVHIPNSGGAVNEKSVRAAFICLPGEFRHVCQRLCRYEGKDFLARSGGESMQHPIVGSNINQLWPGSIRLLEAQVVTNIAIDLVSQVRDVRRCAYNSWC